MEAASFSPEGGLTVAFSAEETTFSDQALPGAAGAFPEEPAAFWGAGSAFLGGVDAFTGVGRVNGEGDAVEAEAGTTGSGA